MTAGAEAIAPERFGEHIVAGSARLSDLIGADGVYLHLGAAAYTSGLVPDLRGLPALLARLPSVPVGRAWSTHRLREEAWELAHLAGDRAGVLLVPLSSAGDVLAWFRGEVSHTVRWAADPERPVVTGRRGQRLTPRGSSSVWLQTVGGQCLPWTGRDRDIAEETYRTLLGAAVRHAAAPSTAGPELAHGDDELKAFARAVSHALKEPLRGITSYATVIKEDSAALDDVTVKRLDTIRWLASRMDELLNSLLEYSRLGLADLRMTPVSLDDVLDDIEETLGARFAEADVQLRRPMRLGVVSGDRIRLQEVLVNLISNAVTYAAADLPRWVEVGSRIQAVLGLGGPCQSSSQGRRAAGADGSFIYSLVVVWFHKSGHQLLRFPFRPWYRKKEEPSFADMLTTLRRVSYEEKMPQPLPKQSGLKTWIAQLTELLSRTG